MAWADAGADGLLLASLHESERGDRIIGALVSGSCVSQRAQHYSIPTLPSHTLSPIRESPTGNALPVVSSSCPKANRCLVLR